MNKNVKSGDRVFFFFSPNEKSRNNGGQIAPATVVGRPWHAGPTPTINVSVLLDNSADTLLVKTSVTNATSLRQAVDNGYCYMTLEQAEGYGIQLDNYYQDLNKLVEAHEAKVVPSEDKPAE